MLDSTDTSTQMQHEAVQQLWTFFGRDFSATQATISSQQCLTARLWTTGCRGRYCYLELLLWLEDVIGQRLTVHIYSNIVVLNSCTTRASSMKWAIFYSYLSLSSFVLYTILYIYILIFHIHCHFVWQSCSKLNLRWRPTMMKPSPCAEPWFVPCRNKQPHFRLGEILGFPESGKVFPCFSGKLPSIFLHFRCDPLGHEGLLIGGSCGSTVAGAYRFIKENNIGKAYGFAMICPFAPLGVSERTSRHIRLGEIPKSQETCD